MTMGRPTFVLLILLLGQGVAAYDSGYWTPSQTTTEWWTPSPTTTSYWSTWTPLTTYTTCYTQENVIVTVTSILPCPVTSTVVYWECCDQCQNNCYNPPTTVYPGWGTTTVTSYTTTTPGAVAPYTVTSTITSNGLVIVMVSTGAVAQSATPSVVYEVSNQAAATLPERLWSSFWPMGTLLIALAVLMALL